MSDPQPLVTSSQVDSDVLRQFVENQTTELEVRRQDLILREKEIDNAHEYSLRLLDANVADRAGQREIYRTNSQNGCMVFLVIGVLLSICFCIALYLNKDQVVFEIIKAVLLVIAGGAGGYSYRTIQEKNEEKENQQ